MGTGARDAWAGYEDHHQPRVMMFLPLRGMATPDPYKNTYGSAGFGG